MWIHGSEGTRTLKGPRTFRAQDLGQRHNVVDEEEDHELYSKKHGKGAHERHCMEDAVHDAWRDEEDRKLRELMQAKERALSTPTPSNGLRKAPSPNSVLYPPDPPSPSGLSGKAPETTKNRRPSSGPRETHDHSLHTAGVSLPLADPPYPPNGTPVRTPIPLGGIARKKKKARAQ